MQILFKFVTDVIVLRLVGEALDFRQRSYFLMHTHVISEAMRTAYSVGEQTSDDFQDFENSTS